jgi:hypothetical protein
VTRAYDLIESFPDRIPVGHPMVFKVKQAQSAKVISRSGIFVRIFPLGKSDQIPRPQIKADDCDYYLATVFTLNLVDDEELRFKRIKSIDKSWMNLSNSGNTVVSSSYFLVFEQGGTEFSEIQAFGIRSSDAQKYFGTGFRITIEDSSGTISADEIREEYKRRENRSVKLKLQADTALDPIPCYSYQPLNVNKFTKSNWDGVMSACSEGIDQSLPYG